MKTGSAKVSGTLHVLLLTPGFPGDDCETDCIPALQNLVEVLHRPQQGIRMTIVALQYPFRRESYRWRNIPVTALGGANKGRPLRWLLWQRAKRLIRRIHSRDPIDLIHVMWLTECALVAQKIKTMLNMPLIATLMGQDARRSNPYLGRINFDKFCITGNSPYVAEVFQQSTGVSVNQVIPLGIDNDHQAFLSTSSQRTIDILGVGSFIALKDYTAFLEIIAVVAKDRPRLRCLLVGDGVERPLLEQRIEQLNLSAHVSLAGHLPREDVLRHMQNARILLHPSQYEAQGYVLLEALASGVQVVCRPVGLYQAGKNIYAEVGNPAMANRVKWLLQQTAPPTADFPITRTESAKRFHALYRQLAAENDLC